MMRTRSLALLLTLICLALPARADHITVIAHPDSPLSNLTAKEVSELYLGRSSTVPGNSDDRIIVLDHPRDSTLRSLFFMRINGMNLSRVNAYWARLQFSGQMQPPPSLPDSQSIVEIVKRNRYAIGYVENSAVVPGVKPLLQLHQP